MTLSKNKLDLLDEIYSIAYWMTGDESNSRELVIDTYKNAETDIQKNKLLKTFRSCYMDRFGQETAFCFNNRTCRIASSIASGVRRWGADIKLSVLLKEISGLRNADISEILDKPAETVCMWLHWGRKLFSHDEILKASA